MGIAKLGRFYFVKDLISFIIKAYKNQDKSFSLYNEMGYSISINELLQKIVIFSKKQLTIKWFNKTRYFNSSLIGLF